MPDHSFFAESPESIGIDSAKLAAVFDRAEKEVREGLLPSSQIAVARNSRIAGMQTVGTATFQGALAPATNDTLYCIFSATKALTSAAAWLLIQEGKLRIDEIVADIVPEFGTHGKDVVTVEQLLIHTAGFPAAPFRPEEFLDRDRRLERFAQWRLNFEPGSRCIYHPSSSMYVVAEIIERRSGRSYGEFVRQRIALPLGLPDLWVGLPREHHGRLADMLHVGEELTAADYERMGLPVPPVTEVNEKAIQGFNEPAVRESGIPAGGGTTTAGDLAMFYQSLLNGGRSRGGEEIWKPETLAMGLEIRSGDMTDPVFGSLANRSLGLIIAGGPDRNLRGFGHTNSERAFGHGGAGGQIGWADPATGISVGYCTNGYDRDAIRQARRGIGISSRAAACALD
ncbi:MAG: serine hydrolase domain-containing protein [Myxococcota bacterium]